jgi:hypothetical protein
MTWRSPADAANSGARRKVTVAPSGSAASVLFGLGHPDRIRRWVFVVAALLLIVGGVLAGTAITSIRSDQGLVHQLRQHSAVASAVLVDLFDQPDPGRRSGPSTSPNWALHFDLPGGAIANTYDTSFDGTASVPLPANRKAIVPVTVRYDPGDVDRVLPASVVAHPSELRLTVQAIVGGVLCLLALGLAGWWYRHESRRRARWRASQTATG